MELPIMNENPFEHVGHHGTTVTASRCDFKEGLKVERPAHITYAQFASDMMEVASWHAIHIHPHLNGFQGYDCINFEIW